MKPSHFQFDFCCQVLNFVDELSGGGEVGVYVLPTHLEDGPGGLEDGAPAPVPGARPRRHRLEGQRLLGVHPGRRGLWNTGCRRGENRGPRF